MKPNNSQDTPANFEFHSCDPQNDYLGIQGDLNIIGSPSYSLNAGEGDEAENADNLL